MSERIVYLVCHKKAFKIRSSLEKAMQLASKRKASTIRLMSLNKVISQAEMMMENSVYMPGSLLECQVDGMAGIVTQTHEQLTQSGFYIIYDEQSIKLCNSHKLAKSHLKVLLHQSSGDTHIKTLFLDHDQILEHSHLLKI